MWFFRLSGNSFLISILLQALQCVVNITVSKGKFACRVLCLPFYLVAVLGDAARCLRGDVLRYCHGLHGLERRWVCSGEAAAHALIDRAIPWENALLSQCALLATHWSKMIQTLEPESTDHRRLVLRCQYRFLTAEYNLCD